MNLRRLFATCLLALLVAACATTSLNKAESNTWLDLRAGDARHLAAPVALHGDGLRLGGAERGHPRTITRPGLRADSVS